MCYNVFYAPLSENVFHALQIKVIIIKMRAVKLTTNMKEYWPSCETTHSDLLGSGRLGEVTDQFAQPVAVLHSNHLKLFVGCVVRCYDLERHKRSTVQYPAGLALI